MSMSSGVLPSCQVIASNLSEEEIMGLKEMFKSMDADNSGSITFEELKTGLQKLGSNMPEDQIRELMEAVRCGWEEKNKESAMCLAGAKRWS